MFSVIDSLLSMYVDVYTQSELQDSNTGEIKKEWSYTKTISCYAKGVISNSATTRSSDKQVFDNKYINDQVLQIRTSEKLNLRMKLTNIRDQKNNVIWNEMNYPSDTPTVFEVVGVTPVTDPFGYVLAYNTTVKRSENQQIGL